MNEIEIIIVIFAALIISVCSTFCLIYLNYRLRLLNRMCKAAMENSLKELEKVAERIKNLIAEKEASDRGLRNIQELYNKSQKEVIDLRAQLAAKNK